MTRVLETAAPDAAASSVHPLRQPFVGMTPDRTAQLLQITAAIADAVTVEQVHEAIVDRIASVLGASSAGLWLVDGPRETIGLARSVGYSQPAKAAFRAVPLDAPAASPVVDCVLTSQPVWVASQDELLKRYPDVAKAATPNRSYRIACLPIGAPGRAIGALGLTIEQARAWSEDEHSFLMLLARYAGQSLERLRLLDAERAARAEADATAARADVLSAASRAFVETDLDLKVRLSNIVEALGHQLNSCVGIALLDADGRLHTSAFYHPSPEATVLLAELTSRPLEPGEGVSGTAAQTGKSILIAAADPEELIARAAPAYRGLLERFPTYAMICSPLRTRGRVIGTVTATRTRAGESYTEHDLSLFEALADRAAAAIENSRLYQDNVEARARAEQLYRFADVVVAAETQEAVFEAALDAIEAALQTDRAAVLMFDDRGSMRFRRWRGLSDEYRRAVDGHSPWSARDQAPAPVLISDIETDESVAGLREHFRKERIGSLAFFPVVSRGELLGKLMVYFAAPHRYTSEEVELVSSLGAHLGSVTARFSAIGRLQETVHYNELFAGILAHDLRNPLAAMITAAQLLRMRFDEHDERAAKPLAKILSSGERIRRMIDQMLDVTRARAGGGIAIERQRVDLVELCEQVVGELELAHPSWVIQSDFSGDLLGLWDRDRLAQVLSNLLSNACTYGVLDAGIRVTIRGPEGGAVQIEVHNKGAIPADFLPTIFEPFRSSSARRAQGRGLGLGLFIVQEIVRAHGGTITVESTVEQGTTFSVLLPRA